MNNTIKNVHECIGQRIKSETYPKPTVQLHSTADNEISTVVCIINL